MLTYVAHFYRCFFYFLRQNFYIWKLEVAYITSTIIFKNSRYIFPRLLKTVFVHVEEKFLFSRIFLITVTLVL